MTTESLAVRGFPTSAAAQAAYDDADLNRAVHAYRAFFPTVSGIMMFRGNHRVGLVDNKVFGVLDTRPAQVGFTLNSDTPYGPLTLDLRDGPLVIEVPAGPLICVALDVHQRWVADMGLPGPDAGEGGTHVLLPPGFEPEDGAIPAGAHVWRSTSRRVIVGVRSLPVGGDVAAALERIKTVAVRPLGERPGWSDPTWTDLTGLPQDTTPLEIETTLDFWRALHEVVDSEPEVPDLHFLYGDLAILGIAKGRPFAPDERMADILERAARMGSDQMRAQAFADRRPDRVVWPDRRWEWAALRFENGGFETPDHLDVDAREKWFFQAIAASPAMFRRGAGAGSVYWLGLRDADGAYLDGSKNYTLSVPLPVPAHLFWSITVYDALTRSQIDTPQGHAALRSLFELTDLSGDGAVDLHFGPAPPPDGSAGHWIQTLPDRGWFTYFRIYGPQEPAFDGSWKPGDFQERP